MWRAVRALGFERGRVLEPGCGSGNFLAFAPDGAQVTGIELDPVTAGIAGLLYPDAEIRAESFADSRDAEGSYDLAIGNVPFGNMVLHDRRHNPAGHSIHNHFIVKALHLVRPGGLVAVLTSRFTMDARNPAARREIASLADLVGAIRLPGGAHQRAAGTSVITDLLVLRRREPGRRAGRGRLGEDTARRAGRRPGAGQRVLPGPPGRGARPAWEPSTAPTGPTTWSSARTATRSPRSTAALDALISSARQRGLAYLPADRGADATPSGGVRSCTVRPARRVPAGPAGRHVHPRRLRRGAAACRPASQAAELADLLALRDSARALLAAEAASAEDTPEIAGLRAELGRRYDRYLAAYGPLNRFSLRRTGRTDPATGEPVLARIRPRQGGFAADPFAPLVYALEQFDPVGQRAAKAAIFRDGSSPRAHRGSAPTPRPTRWPSAWTPRASRGWTRSPACSAPPRTTPAPSSARSCSTTREPGGWSRPPSTCPATCATSCGSRAGGRGRLRGSRSTSPNCAGSSRPT